MNHFDMRRIAMKAGFSDGDCDRFAEAIFKFGEMVIEREKREKHAAEFFDIVHALNKFCADRGIVLSAEGSVISVMWRPEDVYEDDDHVLCDLKDARSDRE